MSHSWTSHALDWAPNTEYRTLPYEEYENHEEPPNAETSIHTWYYLNVNKCLLIHVIFIRNPTHLSTFFLLYLGIYYPQLINLLLTGPFFKLGSLVLVPFPFYHFLERKGNWIWQRRRIGRWNILSQLFVQHIRTSVILTIGNCYLILLLHFI